MKIYVAGKFEESQSVKTLMSALEEMGHTITRDWTQDKETDEDYPIEIAYRDIEAVKKCNIYIGLFINPNSYRGALVELGAALASNKEVLIIGHAIDSCLFVNHPNVTIFDSVSDCLKSL